MRIVGAVRTVQLSNLKAGTVFCFTEFGTPFIVASIKSMVLRQICRCDTSHSFILNLETGEAEFHPRATGVYLLPNAIFVKEGS